MEEIRKAAEGREIIPFIEQQGIQEDSVEAEIRRALAESYEGMANLIGEP